LSDVDEKPLCPNLNCKYNIYCKSLVSVGTNGSDPWHVLEAWRLLESRPVLVQLAWTTCRPWPTNAWPTETVNSKNDDDEKFTGSH